MILYTNQELSHYIVIYSQIYYVIFIIFIIKKLRIYMKNIESITLNTYTIKQRIVKTRRITINQSL